MRSRRWSARRGRWSSRMRDSSPGVRPGDLLARERSPHAPASTNPTPTERPRRRRSTATSAHRRGAAAAARLARLDLAQHRRRPDGVAVPQRVVVVSSTSPASCSRLEVGQRPQQEAPLLLELASRSSCAGRCARRRGRVVPDRRSRRRASADVDERSRSSVGRLALVAARAPRRNATTSAASPQTNATAGSTQTERVEAGRPGTSRTCAPYLASMTR